MMNLAATVLPAPLSPLTRTNQSGLRGGHVTGSRPITAHHSPDDDALVLVVYRHVAVHVVRQRVDVRRVLISCLQLLQSYKIFYPIDIILNIVKHFKYPLKLNPIMQCI